MNSLPQLWLYLILLAAHWVGDYVSQTNWQATNKSRNSLALLQHVSSYTLCLGATSAVLFIPSLSWFVFTVLNGLLHFVTDYCTSRVSSRLYAKQDWRNFFIVVGFDQLIHQVTLAVTMWLIFYR